MSKYIDASLVVEMQTYDDEHEDWEEWNGTIEDLLNQWTDQGCPPAIEVRGDCISRGVATGIVKNYDLKFPQYMERFVTELLDAMKKDLIEDIKNAPSVDIVKCKDCVYYVELNDLQGACANLDRAVSNYDFCNFAERKEQEDEKDKRDR